jgi:hypothetical protein
MSSALKGGNSSWGSRRLSIDRLDLAELVVAGCSIARRRLHAIHVVPFDLRHEPNLSRPSRLQRHRLAPTVEQGTRQSVPLEIHGYGSGNIPGVLHLNRSYQRGEVTAPDERAGGRRKSLSRCPSRLGASVSSTVVTAGDAGLPLACG